MPFPTYPERLDQLIAKVSNILKSVVKEKDSVVYDKMAEAYQQLLSADNCTIFSYHNENRGESLKMVGNAGEWDRRKRIQLSDSSNSTTLASAITSSVTRLHKDYFDNHHPSESQYFARPRAAFLGVQLLNSRSQLIGYIKAENSTNKKQFDEYDEKIAERFSDLISPIFERILSTKKALNVGIPSRPIKSSGNVESVFSQIGKQAMERVDGDQCYITAFDFATETTSTEFSSFQFRSKLSDKDAALKLLSNNVESIWHKDITKSSTTATIAPNAKSCLAVPLAIGQRRFGAIILTSNNASWFDADDKAALLNLSITGSLLAFNAKLQELLKITVQRVLHSKTNNQESFLPILDSINSAFSLDNGLVYLEDDEQKLNIVSYKMRTAPKFDPLHFSHEINGNSLASYVFNNQSPYLALRPDSDPVVSRDGIEKFLISGPLLGVPILQENRSVGAIVLWSAAGYTPSHEDASQIQVFSDLVAVKSDLTNLQNKAELHSKILESLPIGVFVKRYDNEESYGVFEISNTFHSNILGIPAGDALGKTDAHYFSKEKSILFRQRDMQCISQNTPETWIETLDPMSNETQNRSNDESSVHKQDRYLVSKEPIQLPTGTKTETSRILGLISPVEDRQVSIRFDFDSDEIRFINGIGEASLDVDFQNSFRNKAFWTYFQTVRNGLSRI